VLIVIDGGNGSENYPNTTFGKLFKENSMPVKYVDFPQYYSSFHGKTVAKFLRGEFGKLIRFLHILPH
jgi:hypothetical protein